MEIGLLLLMGLIIAVFMFFKPFYGLILTFAVSQADFLVTLPKGISIGRLVASFAVLGWMWQLLRHGRMGIQLKRLHLPKIVVPFLLVCALGVVLHSPEQENVLRVVTVALLMVLSVMVEDLVNTRKRLRLLILVVALSNVTLAILPVMSYFGVNVPGVEASKVIEGAGGLRSQGITDNPNELGLLLNMGIALTTIILFQQKTLFRALPLIGLIGIAVMGIVLSVSRTHYIVFISFVSLIMVLGFLGAKGGRMSFPIGVTVCFGVLAGLAIYFAPSQAMYRASIFGSSEEATTGHRITQMTIQHKAAIDLLGEYPILGVGLGKFRDYARGQFNYIDAHDTISAILGETGILGALAWCAILWACTRRLFSVLRANARKKDVELYYVSMVLLAAFGSMLIGSIGGMVLLYSRLFWLTLGISVVLVNMGRFHMPEGTRSGAITSGFGKSGSAKPIKGVSVNYPPKGLNPIRRVPTRPLE